MERPGASPPSSPQVVQRTVGDQHDLASPRFAGDERLEACFDNEARLTKGERGPSVTLVQQALIDLGRDVGPSGADGIYGSRTWNAVKQFKADERLGYEHMGDVGPGTMRRLDELFPAENIQPITPDDPAATRETGICAGVGEKSEEIAGGNGEGDGRITEGIPGLVWRQGFAGSAAPSPPSCPVPTSLSKSVFQGSPPPPPSPNSKQKRWAASTNESLKLYNNSVEAHFDPNNSWLDPYLVRVDGARAGQDEELVDKCVEHFRTSNGPASPIVSTGCRPFPRPLTASDRSQCYINGAVLDDARKADDTLLLRHEQYHMKLACALAKVGNDWIAKGARPIDVLRYMQKEDDRLQKQYDDETEHGCRIDVQKTWEGAIDAPGGLIAP